TLHGAGTSIGNMTIGYNPYWSPIWDFEHRTLVSGEKRERSTLTKQNGYLFGWDGDYEFGLGPVRLKLIGLRHFEHAPRFTTQLLSFEDADPSQGTRLVRDARLGETIARAEYGWKGGRNDWELSLERALNSVDQQG